MEYLIAIVLSVFFAWLASRVKNKSVAILCSIISVLIPAIIGGLRQVGTGTDTKVYGYPDAMAAYTSESFADFMFTKREPGYGLVCYLTMKTLGHVNWCFFFYQLITLGCFYVGAYKHRKVAPLYLTVLIFMCGFYISSMNIIRQTMAASIIFMGINNLEEKKYWRFIAYIIAAFTFHFSSVAVSVLILGLHIIVAKKTSPHFKYFVLGAAIFLIIFIRPIATAAMQITQSLNLVPVRYLNYMDTHHEYGLVESGVSRLTAVKFITVFCMLLLYSQNGKKLLGEHNFEFYKYNFFLSLILTYVLHLMPRLVMFNDYINILLFSAIPYFVKNKHMKFLLIVILIVTTVSPWYRSWYVSGNVYTNTEWAYRSILENF